MKNLTKTLLTAGAIGLASVLPMQKAEAQINSDTIATEQVQEDNFSAELSGDIKNKSRFWGVPFLDGPMYTQSLNVDYGNFSVSLTGNVDVDKTKLFDVDTHIGYSYPVSETLDLSFGYLRFDFDIGEGWKHASLVHAGLAADILLNPSITYNKLFGFGGGEYVEGALSEDIQITERIGIDLAGKLGFNKNAMREGTGFTHLEGVLNVPITISGKVEVTPRINYFRSLSSDVESGFLAGLNLAYSF